MTPIRRLAALAFVLAAAVVPNSARAQGPGDPDPGILQTVARISYIDGDVSYARGDDPDTWQGADRNVPLTLGDRLYTGNGARIELELNGGEVIRLGAGADLTALNLTEETRQFALKSGVAFFRVPELGPNELFEVDSPNTAVTFERSGEYRIDVDADGNTRLSVQKGSATVAAGGGQVAVGPGAGIRIDGIDAPRYEVIGLPAVDAWDRWSGERDSRALRAHSRQYVNASVAGVADLDDYGQWSQLPGYGWAWSPASVAAGWAPYRAGRWIWQDPWGWTWVSTEPWGWAPYHSGRWVLAASRWCWVPVAPAIGVVHYAPALVAFVGAGPGFATSVAATGGGFVGWFPLAPRDPLIPWWGRHDAGRLSQVTNVTYVNQTYVTVVNQSTFVSGRPVAAGLITERTVVREASAAPVLRGPIPVAPTVASTRVSLRAEPASARPAPAVAARPVVVRVAPPPAPQRFEEKLATIRQNGGAPVNVPERSPDEGASRARAAAVPVRPAASADGKMTLAARGGTTERSPRPPEPVAAPKGRVLATDGPALATIPASVPTRPAPAERVAHSEPPAALPTAAAAPPEHRVAARPAPPEASDKNLTQERRQPTRPVAQTDRRDVTPAPEARRDDERQARAPQNREQAQTAQNRERTQTPQQNREQPRANASAPAEKPEARPAQKEPKDQKEPNVQKDQHREKPRATPHPAPRPTHPPDSQS